MGAGDGGGAAVGDNASGADSGGSGGSADGTGGDTEILARSLARLLACSLARCLVTRADFLPARLAQEMPSKRALLVWAIRALIYLQSSRHSLGILQSFRKWLTQLRYNQYNLRRVGKCIGLIQESRLYPQSKD